MTKSAGIILLFFLLTVIPLGLYAQRHYEPGYVVLTSGDTLYGKIKDRKPEPFGKIYKKIRFRDGGWFAKKYVPSELMSYKAGERTYESSWLSYELSIFGSRLISVPGRGNKQFLRVLVKGPLNYYSLETEDHDSGYYRDIPYLKREDKREIVRATQGIFGLKRKLLAEYFDDCPAMVKALEEKEIRSVFEVVELYQRRCLVNQYYNPDYQK